MIPCINRENKYPKIYERRYGHFYVEVTEKMSKKLQGFLKKYKIKCHRCKVHSLNFHIFLLLDMWWWCRGWGEANMAQIIPGP